MKKIKGNIFIKIVAAIFSYFTVIALIVSVVSIGIMVHLDFYTQKKSSVCDDIMTSLINNEIWYIGHNYMNGIDLEEYYSNKNVLYVVEDSSGEVLSSNYNGELALASVTEEYITHYITKDGLPYDGNVWLEEDGTFYSEYDTELFKGRNEFTIRAYIPQNMEHLDRFYVAYKAVNIGYSLRYGFIIMAAVSLAVCIILFVYLFSTAGYRTDSEDIKIRTIDKIPVDLYTAAIILIFILAIGFIDYILVFNLLDIIVSFLIISILYFITLGYLLSLAVRIKAKTLLENSVIYYILKFILKYLKKVFAVISHIYKNLATVYKIAIAIVAIGFIEIVFISCNAYEFDNLVIGWIVRSIIITAVLILAAIAFQKVKMGGEKIVSGDLESKIDTKYMYGDIKDFAESLNNINNGLQIAINDKMKSERFKTELITNVSHDIKTPLTSIVNYVDLIKKEECHNQKINEYIEVLDRQSSRLKKLIEDLVEASKASTGNLSVELTRCDLSVLINQAVAEYSSRFENKNLEVIQNFEEQIKVLADGRRLWRVFDNLMNNICKYAMPATRVYIDLKKVNQKAVISFKNISNSPLNLSDDDLTERFVRGDRSRNTEGSGLGLSIAKSLTELQNGSFEIKTDGDLFKAIITFKIIEEK